MLSMVGLVLAAGLAGWVDAIVGGGGLIQLPALFGAYPQAAPATLMGTNKGAAIWGTSWAASQYARRVRLRWAALGPAVAAAFVGAASGAWLVTRLPARPLRVALPLVLLALLLYTLARKDLGRRHAPRFAGRAEAAWAGVVGGLIGLYDGAFGPGTGSFFVFAGVRWLGYDFLHASAHAKLLNAATNLAALAWFGAHGHIWWSVALPMAAANVAGSWLGTRAALRHGTGFVRGVFVVVVGALIVKTSWDAAGVLGWR